MRRATIGITERVAHPPGTSVDLSKSGGGELGGAAVSEPAGRGVSRRSRRRVAGGRREGVRASVGGGRPHRVGGR